MPDTARLLQDLAAGDGTAAERLLPLVYGELHRIASRSMRGQDPDHTLQPTALVHEAYLRLVGAPSPSWSSRRHFLAVAAKAMRSVLIDHARSRQTQKRGAGQRPLPLDEDAIPAGDSESVLALHEALLDLARFDPALAELVELRFFGGLEIDDVAAIQGVSASTVKRGWRTARAWLRRALDADRAR